MPEFGAKGPGFALSDSEVDDMFASYTQARSAYFVVVHGARIVGGGGVAPLAGGEADTCELRKMYFLPELRGLGFGQALMDLCLAAARQHGFKWCYLETLANMTQARALYAKNCFKPLTAPRGGTGHFGCNSWYLKEL
ncbi:MAG: GNAT family N-acetyltransferase [Deltaproteobacteria bacterium]|nr:GNAT family N-acetyltransferase [Deltaproteobacteria bacterium]